MGLSSTLFWYSRLRVRSPIRKNFALFTCSSCRGEADFPLAVRVEAHVFRDFHLQFVSREKNPTCTSCGGGLFFFTASRCKFVLRSGFFIFNLQFVSQGGFSTCSSCNVGPCATPPYRSGGAVAPELCVRLYSVGDLAENTRWRGPIS